MVHELQRDTHHCNNAPTKCHGAHVTAAMCWCAEFLFSSAHTLWPPLRQWVHDQLVCASL